jgi:hypothetical protein
MRLLFSLLTALLSSFAFCQQGVAVNTDGSAPAASAMLDVKSTSKGFLVPRMTAAERLAIANPSAGLMVYETTSNMHWIFNGTSWVIFGNSVSQWTDNGSNIFNTTGNVGVGLNANINEKLTIKGNVLATAADGSNRSSINLMGGSFGGGSINFLKPDSSVTGSIVSNFLNDRMVFQHGGNPNQLLLHTNGRIGINNLVPSKALDVDGSIRSRDTVSADKHVRAGQDIYANGDINSGSDIRADGNLSASGIVSGNALVSTGNLLATGNAIFAGSLQSYNSMIIDDAAGILQLKASGENKGFFQLSGNNLRAGTNSGNTGNFVVRTNGADKFFVTSTGLHLFEKLYVNTISASTFTAFSPKGSFVFSVGNTGIFIDRNLPLQREEQGEYDLLPIGIAHISSGGTKIRGTSNITSRRFSSLGYPLPGHYTITCDGVTENSIVQVTVKQPVGFLAINSAENSVFFVRAVPYDGHVHVFIDTRNSPTSYTPESIDASFFITIFK